MHCIFPKVVEITIYYNKQQERNDTILSRDLYRKAGVLGSTVMWQHQFFIIKK